jgi:hypothetical protein
MRGGDPREWPFNNSQTPDDSSNKDKEKKTSKVGNQVEGEGKVVFRKRVTSI